MITVSATAVGIPFDMPMPGIEDWYPNSGGLFYRLIGWLSHCLGSRFGLRNGG